MEVEPSRLEVLVLRIDELERENADLRRQLEEARAAVRALLDPSYPVEIQRTA